MLANLAQVFELTMTRRSSRPLWTASLPVPRRPASPGRASPGQAGLSLSDLAGLAPAMALFAVFIVVPMLGAVALSLFRWNGLGTPYRAGAANWIQFAHDPLARQALAVTAKVVVLSWVVQTPVSIALGLFTAGRQRYRSVYAALYVLPLLLRPSVPTSDRSSVWSLTAKTDERS